MGFSNLSGSNACVALLQRSLERGRLGHAYLVSGDRLDSLEQLARTLAKVLNCAAPPRRGQDGVAVESCDECLSCRKIDADNHPDVRWVRPESKSRVITIDQIREVMQAVSLKASDQGWKVSILVSADRLNVQAANGFLKTLEEPPPRSTMILLSREPQKILETILSRCLRLHMASESGAGVAAHEVAWLREFSQRAVATKAGVMERYRLLGQLLTRLSEMKVQIEKSLSQRSPLQSHDDIDPKLRDRWETELAAAVEAEYRRQRSESLEALQAWLRDIWLASLGVDHPLQFLPELQPMAATIAQRLQPSEAMQNLAVMEQTQRLLTTNIQEALALEVGLLKLKL